MTVHDARKPIRAAIFSRLPQAERAVERLLESGFTKDQITVICSDQCVESHFKDYEHQKQAGSETSKGVTAGGAIGAALGGFGALVGLTATGGVGLVVAGGLLGTGIAGPFIGAMMTRGVEKELADFYDQSVARGKILVAAEDHSERRHDALLIAEKIFREEGSEPFELREG